MSNKNFNKIFLCIILISVSIIFILRVVSPVLKRSDDSLASVFFQKSVDTEELVYRFSKELSNKKKSSKAPIKILIVPGHDNENFGTSFGKITEAELNLSVAKELNDLLSLEKGIQTFLLRDDDGYNDVFKKYLSQNEKEIVEFRNSKKSIMDKLAEEGKIHSYTNVIHNFAPSEVVKILYGINMFANENYFDITIHIHFNDYPGRRREGGKYSGFSIYVPEKQYSNAEASVDLANKIKNQLEQTFAISDYDKESAVTEDQELIAIGSFNTADSAAILIEYGYIYESHFTSEDVSQHVTDELARQTYFGILNYLNNENDVKKNSYSNIAGHLAKRNLRKGDKGLCVLALQNYLRSTGHYPLNSTLNDCPINGNFGDCTEKALMRFQKDNNLPMTGFYGDMTIGRMSK